MPRKGIILAGGTGSRLAPVTMATNKHLLAVYDKPMIYYPLSVLMLAGIREILIIVGPDDETRFRSLLNDGGQWGVNLQYAIQEKPNGLPEAFIIAEDFLDGTASTLILGDSFFYGQGLPRLIRDAGENESGAAIFCYEVHNPEAYGVITFDEHDNVIQVDEKPSTPLSKYAITGLYMFDNQACTFSRTLKTSVRGELEIVDLIRCYMEEGTLSAVQIGRGAVWMDLGTPDSLLQAANYVQVIDNRHRLKISCLEEIAWRQGWLNSKELENTAEAMNNAEYRDYLLQLIE